MDSGWRLPEFREKLQSGAEAVFLWERATARLPPLSRVCKSVIAEWTEMACVFYHSNRSYFPRVRHFQDAV